MSSWQPSAVDDFSKIAGIHEYYTLMIREAFLPELRCAISKIASKLARKSPELDKKLAFGSRTLKRYLTCFEPAIYGAIHAEGSEGGVLCSKGQMGANRDNSRRGV